MTRAWACQCFFFFFFNSPIFFVTKINRVLRALCLGITNYFRIIALVNIRGIQTVFWIVVFFPDFMSVYAQIRSNALARSLQGWVLQSWITHNRYYFEEVVWLKILFLWIKGLAFISCTLSMGKPTSSEKNYKYSIWRLHMQMLCV